MSNARSASLAIFISQKCALSHLENHVLINCYSKEDYLFLIQHRRNIVEALNLAIDTNFFRVEWVTVGVIGDKLRQSFPVKKSEPKSIIISPPKDLIYECLSCEGACGIVRMKDHKGLFSNELITFVSKSSPNDWVGKTMSDYWFPEELENYMERLSENQELRDYSYVAKMMNGQVARLTVDVRLVEWRGETARIVKTTACEILS
jgi:PAS domain-containing protein